VNKISKCGYCNGLIVSWLFIIRHVTHLPSLTDIWSRQWRLDSVLPYMQSASAFEKGYGPHGEMLH